MKSPLLCHVCILYIIVTFQLIIHLGTSTQPGKPIRGGMDDEEDPDVCARKKHFEAFNMKMGLCRPDNISIICASRPIHSCVSNITNFKTTAFVKGELGQCLLEANVTAQSSLQFYIEAKRVLNPNEEGSRGLGGAERHQKAKCMLKYICSKSAITSMTMDCGTVFVNADGTFHNYTKNRKSWKAPNNYKGQVIFFAKIAISEESREVDIASTRIFAKGYDDDDEVKLQKAVVLPATPPPPPPALPPPQPRQIATKKPTAAQKKMKKKLIKDPGRMISGLGR